MDDTREVKGTIETMGIMGILAKILVFIVLMLAASCTHDTWDFYNDVRQQRVDRSKLIADTVLLCGTHSICNQSAIPFPVLSETEQEIFNCAPCKCDVDCWSRGDCCIDLPYLYFTSSCQSTQLIFNGSNVQISSEFSFEMIASCPETDPEIEMKEDCDGFINDGSFLDYDLHAPVTSVITHITYRNKYCASCHGDHDFIRWDRFAECETTFDVNTISTINEFKHALSYYNCSLVHVFPSSPPHIPNKKCVSNYDNHVISTCNKTGLWTDYDPSIEWACINFKPNGVIFKDFRNIFCYMCNPSIATVHHNVIVDRCNMTGEWKLYDKSLEDGCLNLPSIQRLRPYKNSYCMLCNGREPFSYFLTSRIGNLDFDITTLSNGSIALITFSETSLLNLLGNSETDLVKGMYDFDIGVKTAKSDSDNRKYQNNISPSISVTDNVLSKIRLICGENSVCISNDPGRYSNYTDISHTEVYSTFSESPCDLCDCSENCIYDKTCCVDLILNENPYDCISSEIFSSARDQDRTNDLGILAISTCKNISQPAFIRDMCHQQPFSNLISSLPGIIDGSVIFKNIFCSYCHDFKDNFQPLDITITCSILMEPTMFMFFSSLLRTTLERKCNVRVVATSHDICRAQTLMVSKCNITGEWKNYDQNIENMCEREEQFSVWGLNPLVFEKKYKNIFCFMCNPEISTESVIRHCNVTGNWKVYDPVTEQACEQAPEHIVWYPYKNWFCSRCNEEMYNVKDNTSMTEPGSYFGTVFSPTYRYLFSFKLPSSIDLRKEEIDCSDGIYDSYKMACSKVYCPAGRHLKNGRCVVLLEETKNLRYSITFPLLCISDQVTYAGGLQDLLQNISSTIMNKLLSLESELEIKYSNTWTYKACEEGEMSRHKTIINQFPTIFFHANISIRYTRNRTALERALLGFRKTNFQLQYYGMNLTFRTMQFTMMNESNNTHPCRHTYITKLKKKEKRLEYRLVSDMMACVMVELSKNEYVYKNQTETIMVNNINHIFKRHDFEFQTDGSIRVCRDHINQGTLNHRINISHAFSYQIRSSPSIPSNSRNKRNFCMYVKLSTIAGIAWLFQIIDGLLELSVFSFFVTFANALQGMFIFVSYICNRRVWKLYMDNCCSSKKPKKHQNRVTYDPTQLRNKQTYL
ncbi:hypothetical protein CHS0354_043061 [Potamilus streckersoni]|uniref:Uncharacterized protein n=1 Tax=Potamilus streckersoni TaxID=2493646 RepID=A0AAE0SE02_9BIVA|nr:hypothetical protein CHS0354_043061 [Potamilus streckersoni]